MRLCGALLNMADLFDRFGRLTESAQYYQQAREASRSPECAPARGFAHLGLGGVAKRLTDPATAESHYRTALDIAGAGTNPTLECAARLDLDDLLLARGALREAGRIAAPAPELSRAAGERPQELRAHNLLDVIHREQGRQSAEGNQVPPADPGAP